jgi:hypothetical protein
MGWSEVRERSLGGCDEHSRRCGCYARPMRRRNAMPAKRHAVTRWTSDFSPLGTPDSQIPAALTVSQSPPFPRCSGLESSFPSTQLRILSLRVALHTIAPLQSLPYVQRPSPPPTTTKSPNSRTQATAHGTVDSILHLAHTSKPRRLQSYLD